MTELAAEPTCCDYEPVDVPADDLKNYREIDHCEGCSSTTAPIRAIKMVIGRRWMLCRACFTREIERGTVDPADPRVQMRTNRGGRG